MRELSLKIIKSINSNVPGSKTSIDLQRAFDEGDFRSIIETLKSQLKSSPVSTMKVLGECDDLADEIEFFVIPSKYSMT